MYDKTNHYYLEQVKLMSLQSAPQKKSRGKRQANFKVKISVGTDVCTIGNVSLGLACLRPSKVPVHTLLLFHCYI